MNFLFEITEDYLINYHGKEVFRARVIYSIKDCAGITDVYITFPLNALPYIRNNTKLATDILTAVYEHASVLIEEDKEFNNIKS